MRNSSSPSKNNTPLTNWISKINSVLIDNAKNLDVLMPMHNLIVYIKSYGKTTDSLWNYYRDEPNDPPAGNYNADSIINSASFKYKASITGQASNINQENGENTK